MCCCVGSTIGEGEPEGLAKMGSIYVDSDTDTIYYSTGTEWIEIPSGGDTSNFVTLDGDQTIDDVKTFSESPIVPEPTTDQQAASKKYVDDNAGGGLPTICVIDAYGTDYGETGFVYSVIYNNTGRTLSAAWDEDFEGGKFIFELSGAYTDNYSCIALGSYTFTAIDMRYLGRIGSAQVGEVIVDGSDNGNPDYSVRITITIYE
jgi:hypothetical protein